MRLINITTGSFEEFIGRNIPKYAILSHTWEEEEVTFNDVIDSHHRGKKSYAKFLKTTLSNTQWKERVTFKDVIDSRLRSKKGYAKIAKMCELASKLGLKYAWVDTCCIDKSSSAELTEAINSMYRWYERSEVCYTYLSDLPAAGPNCNDLQNCRWFTRGWTLQELIASRNVYFFDRDWNIRGTKENLLEELSRITGINIRVLRHEQPLSSVAIAQKMSWAAHRETTRIEDIAYCLLGIFNVHMPLLYGEEEKAFRRLQEEIIKSTTDLSIFAWREPIPRDTEPPKGPIYCGVLAESPLAFSGCELFEKHLIHGHEFSVTNNGIKTQIQILGEYIPEKGGYRYILPLYCSVSFGKPLGIRVRMCGIKQFIREDPYALRKLRSSLGQMHPAERYLLTELPAMNLRFDSEPFDMSSYIAQTRPCVLQIGLPFIGSCLVDLWPRELFDHEDQLFLELGSGCDTCAMRLKGQLFVQVNGGLKEIEFDSMFIVVGWSALDIERLQCSLINYQSFSTSLTELQHRLADLDYSSSSAPWYLNFYKIPKSQSVVFKDLGVNVGVSISFKPTLVTDPKICLSKFWRIEISFRSLEAEDIPQTNYEDWIPDPYDFGQPTAQSRLKGEVKKISRMEKKIWYDLSYIYGE